MAGFLPIRAVIVSWVSYFIKPSGYGYMYRIKVQTHWYDYLSVWMYFGLIGAFLFILIQLVLLVDFAHSWNSSWVEKMEEGGSKVWAGLLLFFTFLMYGTAVAGIICLYIYFTHGVESAPEKKCHTNKFFISFNLILCVIASALAIHPKIQERQPRSGMFFENLRDLNF